MLNPRTKSQRFGKEVGIVVGCPFIIKRIGEAILPPKN
jgi:hypothetical protein